MRTAQGSNSKLGGIVPEPPGTLGVVSSAGTSSAYRLHISKEEELHLLNRQLYSPWVKKSGAESEREISLQPHQVCDAVRGLDLHI